MKNVYIQFYQSYSVALKELNSLAFWVEFFIELIASVTKAADYVSHIVKQSIE